MLGIRKINQGILHLPLYGLPVKKTRPRASKNPSFFFLLNTILVNVQNFETDSLKMAKNKHFLSSIFLSSNRFDLFVNQERKTGTIFSIFHSLR